MYIYIYIYVWIIYPLRMVISIAMLNYQMVNLELLFIKNITKQYARFVQTCIDLFEFWCEPIQIISTGIVNVYIDIIYIQSDPKQHIIRTPIIFESTNQVQGYPHQCCKNVPIHGRQNPRESLLHSPGRVGSSNHRATQCLGMLWNLRN